MTKKVGIPRALFYYKYYPLWKTFFEEIGAEVVVSQDTTKRVLDEGVKACVDEACMPIKLYYGHIANLKDRVDYLFIPRLTSVSKNEYICPKFGGLPDMVRHSFKDLPPIIDTEINLRKSKHKAVKAALEIGSVITEDKRQILKAYEKALENYYTFKQRIKQGMLPNEAIGTMEMQVKRRSDGSAEKALKKSLVSNVPRMHSINSARKRDLNIAVIGHVYNLYDSYINMDMINKLKGNGANVLTIEMMQEDMINNNAKKLPKRMFWNFGRKAMGSAMHLLENEEVDGIIYLMTFGCGIDSFVCDLVERKIRRTKDTPFTVLTIDEHSGEAGINTRLEAFIDMIRWRNKNESNLSTHGKHIHYSESNVGGA